MTQFAIPDTNPISSVTFDSIVAIDISGFTGVGDYISLSLPAFPRTKVDLTKTFVDFTSNSEGDFGVGPVDQIAFSEADPALPAVAGDTEMQIPLSLLKNIDKSSLTGVRFRIYATEECNFRCLSIRACAEDWAYAPIDLDTLWNRVHRPPSPNGKANPSITFPAAPSAPKAWPIIFRANSLTGLTDPMPVNLDVGVAITSGSLTQAAGKLKNEFALFFRDVPTDNQTQIEMDTMSQSQLEIHSGQPDFGTALYDARVQKEVDLYGQTELDEKSQFDIERKADESEHTWIEVKLKWGEETSSNELTIFNADEVGYAFTDFVLDASSVNNLDAGVLWLVAELQDSTIHVRIYSLNQVGEISSEVPLFDSGLIYDDNLIKRRKGRFGWWTNLRDGDAHIDNIRTRGTNYGEIVSKEFHSITPIKGASLYAGSTADHELVSGVEPTDRENMTISLDPSASATGDAIKIEVTPLKPLQGIVTNEFLIDDPNNLHISLDLKFPSSEIPGGGLSAFLLGPYESIYPVNLSSFTKNTWTHVKVSLKDQLFQTGIYKFVLLQPLPVVATTWWIEHLYVKTYSVKWSARAHKSDAWNIEGDRWQNAGFTLNSLNGGVVFDELGNGLQVRAQAFRQDAVISDFKAIPQYAPLGRLVYRDEFTAHTQPEPKLKISTSKSKLTVTFTASQESAIQLVAYYWNFGDGTEDAGLSVAHTYKGAGSYVVTLMAQTSEGHSTSIQKTVTV